MSYVQEMGSRRLKVHFTFRAFRMGRLLDIIAVSYG
jgi:hypothetical protein